MRRRTWTLLALTLALLALAPGCNDLEQADLADGEGVVEGVVTDADGAPVADAHVLVEGDLSLYTTSAADGSFRLERVPAGPHRVIGYTPAGLGAALEVTVLAGEVTPAALSLAPTATIRGAVTLAGGADPVGTLVYLLGTSFAAYTDHDGAFTMFFVVPGCYTLRAERDGYVAKEVGPVCVLRGEVRDVDEFTLLAGGGGDCSADAECPGRMVCVERTCVFEEGFGVETCDGADNDGDGLVDEGLVEACGSDVGACEAGVSLCLGGVASPCLGAVEPVEEVCGDGRDDDCDGAIDEDCGPVCGDGRCEGGEDPTSCPADCPTCGPCGACEACDPGSGECVALPCVVECETDGDCLAGERCAESTEGCCGRCVAADCLGEGEWSVSGEDATCCPGLTALRTAVGVLAGVCEPVDCGVYHVCAACGDGTCGVGESFCTCPDDCAGDCLAEGNVIVGESGCCAGLDALPLGDPLACALSVCADCGDGTCDYGESGATCPADCCVPDCGERECGDDGCGGTCGTCAEGCDCQNGMCLGDASVPETLAPDCVHVPPVVGAGQEIAIAVYGTTTGCTTFTRATATLEGTTVTVAVEGSTSTCGPCPSCLWTYAGMAFVTLPNPGPYTVSVGGETYPITASGGIVGGTPCDDACVPLSGDDWVLTYYARTPNNTACGGDLFESTAIMGGCQDYEVTTGADWQLPTDLYACTEDQLFFGGDPTTELVPVTATRCEPLGGGAQEVILGVSLATSVAEIFVIER